LVLGVQWVLVEQKPLSESKELVVEENIFRSDCTWEELFQPNFPLHSDSYFAVERVEREALCTPCIA
jgi:hypothetical protein